MEPHQHPKQIQAVEIRGYHEGRTSKLDRNSPFKHILEVHPSKKPLTRFIGSGVYIWTQFQPFYEFNVSVATHSTCTVCGNKSTG